MGLEIMASYSCGVLPEHKIENFSSTCWPILSAISGLDLVNAFGQDKDTLVLFAAKVPSDGLECRELNFHGSFLEFIAKDRCAGFWVEHARDSLIPDQQNFLGAH
jgi:hypothetical protein